MTSRTFVPRKNVFQNTKLQTINQTLLTKTFIKLKEKKEKNIKYWTK